MAFSISVTSQNSRKPVRTLNYMRQVELVTMRGELFTMRGEWPASLKLSMAVYGQTLDGRPSR